MMPFSRRSHLIRIIALAAGVAGCQDPLLSPETRARTRSGEMRLDPLIPTAAVVLSVAPAEGVDSVIVGDQTDTLVYVSPVANGRVAILRLDGRRLPSTLRLRLVPKTGVLALDISVRPLELTRADTVATRPATSGVRVFWYDQ